MTSTCISPSFTSSLLSDPFLQLLLFLVFKYLVGNWKGILDFSYQNTNLYLALCLSHLQHWCYPLTTCRCQNSVIFGCLFSYNPHLIHQQNKVLWALNPRHFPASALELSGPRAIILWLSHFPPASPSSFRSFWSAWRLTETFQSHLRFHSREQPVWKSSFFFSCLHNWSKLTAPSQLGLVIKAFLASDMEREVMRTADKAGTPTLLCVIPVRVFLPPAWCDERLSWPPRMLQGTARINSYVLPTQSSWMQGRGPQNRQSEPHRSVFSLSAPSRL